MKCDNCENLAGYTLGQDECGAGHYFEYCKKGHWEGGGQIEEEENCEDFWKDCEDYEFKNKEEV
jgi:hypothetical protein